MPFKGVAFPSESPPKDYHCDCRSSGTGGANRQSDHDTLVVVACKEELLPITTVSRILPCWNQSQKI